MTMRELFGDDDEEEELIPDRPESRPPEAVDPTMHGEPSSSSRGPAVPHDPTRMPDGEPVRFLPILTGMGLDLLGIGGDLEGPLNFLKDTLIKNGKVVAYFKVTRFLTRTTTTQSLLS